jgi:hypothetical protein
MKNYLFRRHQNQRIGLICHRCGLYPLEFHYLERP